MSTHRTASAIDARLPSRLASACAVGRVFVVAGALFVTSGLDCRRARPAGLQRDRPRHRRAPGAASAPTTCSGEVAALNRDVDALGKDVDDAAGQRRCSARSTRCAGPAGFEEVHGPAVTVVLSDAPKDEIDSAVENGEVTADQLVVHQQDIQAVVNALWAGGAEAMTLQKQRVISTTGIKCVGNTVVLHGVPYAPPYEITAIGDLDALQDSLDSSDYIDGYKTYVDAHNLGYEVSTDDDVTMPAYDGSSDLRYAKAEHGSTTVDRD